MYFDQHSITPRFEFGFGLSYQFTAFYSGLSITSTGTNAYVVTVSVENTGSQAGTEIAQLYLGYPSGAGEPPKVLRGFDAVALNPGQTQSVSFSLVAKDIRFVRPSMPPFIYPSTLEHVRILIRFRPFVIPPWKKTCSVWDSVTGSMVRPKGTFTVYVGSSSRNIALTGTF
jgi:beta-glucosidase